MSDLTSPRVLWTKGALFVLAGGLAAMLLWLDRPTMRTAALLALAVWCFCRAYYFAFYVIERYVDPSYRYSGLIAFVRYALRGAPGRSLRNGGTPAPAAEDTPPFN